MKKTVSLLLVTFFLLISFPLYAGVSIEVLRPTSNKITSSYPSSIYGEVVATSDTGSIVSVVFEVENQTFEGKPQGGDKYSFFTDLNQGSHTIKITANDSVGNQLIKNHTFNLYTRCVDELYIAEKSYVGGDRAVFENTTYEAKWWTQGETPGTGSTWVAVYECTFNEDPVVNQILPAKDNFFLAGDTLQVEAAVVDDQGIDRVEFLYGSAKVVKTTAPYTATFAALDFSSQVTIIAYDNMGSSVRENRLIYAGAYGMPFIRPANEIGSLTVNALINEPVTFKFDAFDTDGGTIDHVKLYCYGEFLGEDYEAPYEITTTRAYAGNCNMLAQVFDNEGKANTAPFMGHFYTEDPCAGLSPWKADVGYAKGAQVIFEGRVYTANEWNYNVMPGIDSNYKNRTDKWSYGSFCVLQ